MRLTMTTYTEEIDGQEILEPIEIDTVKKYIGYRPNAGEDDALIGRSITTARSRLEDRLGRAIVRRQFVTRAYISPPNNIIQLRPPLRNVLSVVGVDAGGNEIEITRYNFRPDDGACVFVDVDASVRSFIVTYESGYDDAPPNIKSAIMMLCKAEYERSTDDVIGQLRNELKRYWKENI